MAAPLSPEALMSRHRGAAWLSITSGRTRLGVVIDTRSQGHRAPAAPAFAFDPEGAFVGEYACRRDAVGALVEAGR